MNGKKMCSRCEKMLDYIFFHKTNAQSKTGLKCYCKKCCLEYKKINYHEKIKVPIQIDIIEGEIWMDIKNYEFLYMASNFGRVKSCAKISYSNHQLQERILISTPNKLGYLLVGLYKDKINKRQSVHRMIANCFIENPNNLPEVNHKNGIKTDNRVENLEWCTRSENLKHCYKLGLRSNKGKKYVKR